MYSFRKSFRLSKDAFKYILEEISDVIQGKNAHAIQPIIKLAAVLRFFAEGNYQHGIGQDFNISIAQPTFSKILIEVLNAFETKQLLSKWISIQMTNEEKTTSKRWFYEKTGFPGIIGCVPYAYYDYSATNRRTHFF